MKWDIGIKAQINHCAALFSSCLLPGSLFPPSKSLRAVFIRYSSCFFNLFVCFCFWRGVGWRSNPHKSNIPPFEMGVHFHLLSFYLKKCQKFAFLTSVLFPSSCQKYCVVCRNLCSLHCEQLHVCSSLTTPNL